MEKSVPDFQLNHTFFVKEINCEIQEYTHLTTKAKHYHILPQAPFNNENGFAVFLKTMPQDSKGVAHILEHTVLCGSEKYPVKAPFFKMLNRSAATFMNAMTSADYTEYPFATQNDADYMNLLQLYLDSVFHSNLNELDFLQEGWRFEYPDNDPTKPLDYKGVVLNEMRGAMGSEVREIYQNFLSHTFKDTVYRHNSGGEPLDIPQLTYQELLDFYNTYYHPSNSVFFTYGTYPIEKTQAEIAACLKNFQYKEVFIPQSLYLESEAYKKSNTVKSALHFNPEVPLSGDNSLFLTWFCGDNASLQENYELEIFSEMIASPESKLQKFLDNEHLLLSDINGFLNHTRQTLYTLGVKNLQDQEVDGVKKVLLEKLQEVKNQEFSKEKMHSILDNIELQIKEQKAGGMPYSIELIEAIKKRALAGLPLEETFNIEGMFQSIRSKIDNGTLISSIFDTYLQPAYMKEFVSSANSEVNEKKHKKEKDTLLARSQKLTESERHQIVKKAKQLAKKQNQEAAEDAASAEILPKLRRSDIDAKIDESLFSQATLGKNLIHYENQSGVAYTHLFFDLPFTGQSPYNLLVENAYYSFINGHCAYGDKNLEQSDIERSKHIVDYTVDNHLYKKHLSQTNLRDTEHVAQLCVVGKNLDTKAATMFTTLCESFFEAKFDDPEQIHHILYSYTENLKDHNNLGTKLMQNAASQDLDATSALTGEGLEIKALQEKIQLCEKILSQPERMSQFISDVRTFHEGIVAHNSKTGPVLRVVSRSDTRDQLAQIFQEKIQHYMGVDIAKNKTPDTVLELLDNLAQPTGTSQVLIDKQKELDTQTFTAKKVALVGPTNIAHNFRSYRLEDASAEDMASLSITSAILNTKYLHKLIREQGGAYGARAGAQSTMFSFSSWRDPQVQGTFDNFDKALELFMQDKIEPDMIEETIIRTLSNINSVKDNRSKISKSFEQERTNKKEIRQLSLDAILGVSEASMKCAVQKLLLGKPYQNYTYCSEAKQEELLAQGWQTQNITAIQALDEVKPVVSSPKSKQ